MKWQRSIGLLLAGAALVLFAVWYTQRGRDATAQAPAGKTAVTNAPARTTARLGTAPTTNVPPAAGKASANATTPRTGTRPALPTSPPTAATTSTNAATLAGRWQEISQKPWFYPVAAAVPLLLGLAFLVAASRSKRNDQAQPATSKAAIKRRPGSTAAVQQCNVLQLGPDSRSIWHFTARSGRFALGKEQRVNATEPLPGKLFEKDWRSLFQRKLNVAWLPSDQVFLRVLHLPQADLDETLQMVEFQLEKLSPMPVPQVAWTLQVLPHAPAGMQTVVIIIVARGVVEDFLGKLEAEGYMADRLELPLLDQLQATAPEKNGVWIYPNKTDGSGSALAAWHYDGVLRNLDLITPAPDGRAQSLREQLTQMAWAGELEGWLSSPPAFHLVADAETAAQWEPALRDGLDQPVEVVSPLRDPELAASTADRAAHSDPRLSILPPEYTTRYHQQFVDRLWMRALGAVVMLYIAGVAVYLIAVQVALFRTKAVEAEVAQLGPTYTNAMQLKAQHQVLKDRQELKFAALDCWRAVAELLPETIQLEGFNFSDGRRLVLQGTSPMGQVQQIYQFEGALRKVLVQGQPLFHPTKGESVNYHTVPGGAALSWSFTLELKRSEAQ